MNLQEDIHRIQKIMGLVTADKLSDDNFINLQEETIKKGFKEDIIKVLDRNGIETTSKLVDGYDNLIKLLGDYQIQNSLKIKTIKDCLKRIGGSSLYDFDEEPIPYREMNTEYQEIVYLGINNVVVDRWGGHENESHLGEFPVRYEDLTEKTIDDILRIVLNLIETF
jgi:hypothetical protein